MKIIKRISILLAVLMFPCPWVAAAETNTSNEKQRKEPNLYIDVSKALINAAVQRSIDRTEPAEETILETPVQAMSRTQGSVWAELAPSPGWGAVDVVFQGCVWSRSVAFRPHVLVYTSTVTPLQVRRRVVVSAEGFRTIAGPSCAKTTITTLDVASRQEPDAWAVRFARNAAIANLGLAESETAGKTAKRTSNRMAEDLSPALISVSDSVSRGLKEIKREGLGVECFNLSSTPAILQARVRIVTPGRTQPGPVPTMLAPRDIGLAIHESLINEAAQAVHGGQIIYPDQITKFHDDVTKGLLLDTRTDNVQRESLKTLEKLIASVAEKPATFTLAKKDPIRVAFNDDGFILEISIASVRLGTALYAGKRVHAAFRLENSPAGVYLVRQGPVKLLPAKDLSAADKTLKDPSAAFLLVEKGIFAELLKERVLLARLPLPASASTLSLAPPISSARDGWLMLAWQLRKKAE